ncbi:unnamed protein product [Fraxinus pennsylvanica]|uniref:Uncharacterized protein n=1 Tax=Fraxinus pennsylvanica TaxID=56036 RepID=A0AAD2AFA8_9LAMI|nr:unnamed protein product [Fraxinus pennsylvanica]
MMRIMRWVPREKKFRPGISNNIISELSDCNAALSRLWKKQQIVEASVVIILFTVCFDTIPINVPLDIEFQLDLKGDEANRNFELPRKLKLKLAHKSGAIQVPLLAIYKKPGRFGFRKNSAASFPPFSFLQANQFEFELI